MKTKAVRKRPRRPASMRGITRIDQPEKFNHGWFVRITRQGKTYSMFFSDRLNGGKGKALAAAKKGYASLFRTYGKLPTGKRGRRS